MLSIRLLLCVADPKLINRVSKNALITVTDLEQANRVAQMGLQDDAIVVERRRAIQPVEFAG